MVNSNVQEPFRQGESVVWKSSQHTVRFIVQSLTLNCTMVDIFISLYLHVRRQSQAALRGGQSSPVEQRPVHFLLMRHVLCVLLLDVIALDAVQDLVAKRTAVLYVKPLSQADAVEEVAASRYLRRSHLLKSMVKKN